MLLTECCFSMFRFPESRWVLSLRLLVVWCLGREKGLHLMNLTRALPIRSVTLHEKMWDACIYSNFNLQWVPVLLWYCHGWWHHYPEDLGNLWSFCATSHTACGSVDHVDILAHLKWIILVVAGGASKELPTPTPEFHALSAYLRAYPFGIL